MELEQRTLRVGAAVIACAVVFRLLSGGVLGQIIDAMSSPEVASFILYLETGRVVRPVQPQTPTEPTLQETQPPQTQPPTEPPVQAVFSPEDASLVEINNVCGYDADVNTLMQQPLSWELTGDEPTVLILHSHGTESYTKTEDYEESSGYRTLNENYNVVSIGTRIAQLLEAGGVKVIHDKTLHDYPSYNGSYDHARDSIEEYLTQYPSIQLVLDIHRDAMEDSDGHQIGYTVDVNGQTAAQLMLVVGTDAGGLTHPNWRENMALAVKLHAQLEKTAPGICRPISFRSQRFNQDLSAGAMLVEVGAAGNTRQEALLAAEVLSQTILDLAHGTA